MKFKIALLLSFSCMPLFAAQSDDKDEIKIDWENYTEYTINYTVKVVDENDLSDKENFEYKVKVLTLDELSDQEDLPNFPNMSTDEKLFRYNFGHLFDNTDEARPTNDYLNGMKETLSNYAQLKEASESAKTVEWVCNLIHDNGMATYPKITTPLWLGTPQALELAKKWYKANECNKTYLGDLATYQHLMSNFKIVLHNYKQIKTEIENEIKN